MTTDNDLALAEVPLNYARMSVRDLVQRAYDAGRSSGVEGEHVPKPTADEVNKAIKAVEDGAVKLAHARMEETAKRCGFEGLTELIGYMLTSRPDVQLRLAHTLLREFIDLCALGDTDETTEAYGWGDLIKRANAAIGGKAPPEVEAHELAIGPLVPEGGETTSKT